MSKEIEIRFELLNLDELTNYLNVNANKISETYQIDTYYDNPLSSFVKDFDHIYDWLRVRNENGVFSLNYKHWLPDGEIIRTYCEEQEILVSSAKDMNQLLENLGFKVLVVVNKRRTVWLYNEYEIAIDVVADLGEYIEIEYKGRTIDDVHAIHRSLYDVLSEISADVGLEDHGGYGFKLMKKQRDL